MSYTEISKEKLKDWCQAALRQIYITREECKDRCVKRGVSRINSGFFHRLFKRKDVTFQEVYDWYENQRIGFSHPWFLSTATGGKCEDTALGLLSLCKVGVGTVHLTREDAETLSGWADKP